jgi:hypothetical protein
MGRPLVLITTIGRLEDVSLNWALEAKLQSIAQPTTIQMKGYFKAIRQDKHSCHRLEKVVQPFFYT